MSKVPLCALGAALSIIASPVSAALIDNGEGPIYDTDLNVTWLNLTGPTDFPFSMSWMQAIDWASNLKAGDVSGWRLPMGRSEEHTSELQSH